MAAHCNAPGCRHGVAVRPLSYGSALVASEGRNAPCPCGSGRKYKRCCQLEEERLARQARLDSEVGRAIADWSAATCADELADAFEEFHPESRRVDDGAFTQFFTWFNCDRGLPDGRTPVERYAAHPDLDPDEREIAELIARRPARSPPRTSAPLPRSPRACRTRLVPTWVDLLSLR